VPNLVPREHLPNAISLNTGMVQVARSSVRRRRRCHRRGRGGLAHAINSVSYLVGLRRC
jgi:hypothetical protein